MKKKALLETPGCYGQFRELAERCAECSCRNYCRDSVDPPLLGDYASTIEVDTLPAAKNVRHSSRRSYSRDEMIELMGFMLNLDFKTLHMLADKLENPGISMAQLGEKRKISRQAVHKFIVRRCREIPELSSVMLRRKNMTENNRNSTFMEVVCQIREQTRKTLSSEPKPNSNSSSSLTCLSRSLDLSRLSIGKDTKTSPTD